MTPSSSHQETTDGGEGTMEWHHEAATLILINKFGREDAHGRGLRPVIAEAPIAEIPLVIGVCDFLTFVGDSVTRLRLDVEAITAWCRNAIERGAHSRLRPRPASVQA